VLRAKYGRIHLNFARPISLVELARSRQLPALAALDDEQMKGLVRALANRVMHGISSVTTVTPQALLSCCLLSHRRPALPEAELLAGLQTLLDALNAEGLPLSTQLRDRKLELSKGTPLGEALRTLAHEDKLRVSEAGGQTFYQVVPERRVELAFFKNTVLNPLAPRALVATALLPGGRDLVSVQERALFLSRLFKREFMYQVGSPFETSFAETAQKLERADLVVREGDRLMLPARPEARAQLQLLADLIRDHLEGYRVVALALVERSGAPVDRKTLVRDALEQGRAHLLSGRISAPESLARPTLENAVALFGELGVLQAAASDPSNAPDATNPHVFAARIEDFLRRVSN
jgi:glycerol-3-phosphate O-acyltransferase